MIFERKYLLFGLVAIMVACGGDISPPPGIEDETEGDLEVGPLLDALDSQPDLPDVSRDPADDWGEDLQPDMDADLPPPGCLPGEEDLQIFDCRGGDSIAVTCPCVGGEFVCGFDSAIDCRPFHCDDGLSFECAEDPPLCRPGEIPARREGCWACVDEVTCELFIPCGSDVDCPDHRFCDPCRFSSCPTCDDCVAACVESPCSSESARSCLVSRPVCAADEVSIVQDGCWVCVNAATCEPYEGTCRDHLDCGPADLCDPCGTTSCPDCEDCVPDCVDTLCESEPEPTCEEFRPECADGLVAIVEGGCWRCATTAECGLPPECRTEAGFCTVGLTGCPEGATRSETAICLTFGECCISDDPLACPRLGGACVPDDIPCPEGFAGEDSVICVPSAVCCAPAEPPERRCDDHSTLICDSDPPACDVVSELALIAGCWECVNSVTCRPWGEPGCIDVRDCGPGEFCDFCGTSSCPSCGDCVPACEPVD